MGCRLFGLALLCISVLSYGQVPEDGLTSRELGIAASLPESRVAILARGEQVYDYWCKTCHGAEAIKPGTGALQAKYQGNVPAVLVERNDLQPDFVKLMVRQGISMMPFFRPTEISNPDLEALAAFLAPDAR